MAFDSWPQLLRDFVSGNMKDHYDQARDMNFSNLPTPRRDLLPNFSYISKNSIQATYGSNDWLGYPQNMDVHTNVIFVQLLVLKKNISEGL